MGCIGFREGTRPSIGMNKISENVTQYLVDGNAF